jgi:AhpD family alkylhydroperoxidase
VQTFIIDTPDAARASTDPILVRVGEMLGFVPNIFATVAESAPALAALVEMNQRFAESSFDATEREVIQTAASVENEAPYCVAGHTAFAAAQGVASEVIAGVRASRQLDERRLEALRCLTRALMRRRGADCADEIRQFVDAGYSYAQVLEAILGVCVKTFTNLASNALGVSLDEPFAPYAWLPHAGRDVVN